MLFIGNDPVCKANKKNIMDGEYLQMDCIVNYAGDMSPLIRWSRSDGINVDSHEMITTSVKDSMVSKLRTLMTMEANTMSFISKISFDPLPPSSYKGGVHEAINAPNYQFIWRHQPNVLCK